MGLSHHFHAMSKAISQAESGGGISVIVPFDNSLTAADQARVIKRILSFA